MTRTPTKDIAPFTRPLRPKASARCAGFAPIAVGYQLWALYASAESAPPEAIPV
jgi:hypothetical protein